MFLRKRLARHLDEVLETDEKVLGRLFARRGPSMAKVIVGALFSSLFIWVILNTIWGLPGFLATTFMPVVLAVDRRIIYVNVARTDRNVIVVEDAKWPRNSTSRGLVARLDMGAIGAPTSDGDPTVQIGEHEYWVQGADEDTARRLSKLSAPPTS